MDFTPVSQNGVKPVDTLYSKPSPHLLIANTTSTSYGHGVYLKCINTAPYPKDVPAEFFAYTAELSTSTSLGTQVFTGATATIYTHSIPTGTNTITVVWPGESKWEGFTTTMTNTIHVAPGIPLGYPITITASPNPAVINEPVTFRASTTASSVIMNGSKEDWYFNTVDRGYSYFTGTSAVFTTSFNTIATESVYARWNGGLLNGENYVGQFSNTLSLPVNERGTLNSSLTLSSNSTIYRTVQPIILTATLNTATIFTGTKVYWSGGLSNVPINSLIQNTSTVVVSSSIKTYATGTVLYTNTNGMYIFTHDPSANYNPPRTTTTSSTATSTTTTIASNFNISTFFGGRIETTINSTDTIMVNSLTTYESYYGEVGVIDPGQGGEGASAYINEVYLNGPTTWAIGSNIEISSATGGGVGSVFKQGNNWWYCSEPYLSSNPNGFTTNCYVIPIKGTSNTATITVGYVNWYSGQETINTITTTTTFTVEVLHAGHVNYIISTATALVNNTATITIPANILSTGTYDFGVYWSGTTVTPKYYSITADSISTKIVDPIDPSFNVSVTPSVFEYFNGSGNINTATISSTITVLNTSGYSTPAPTGTVILQDANGLQLGTGTLSRVDNTSSNSTITWNPYNINQLIGNSESLTVIYSGDIFYNAGSYSSPGILTIEKLKPSLSLGNRNRIISGSNQGLYYGGSVDLYANFSVYDPTRTPTSVTFYIDGVAQGTSAVSNGTVALTNVSVSDFNYDQHEFTVGYTATSLYSGSGSITFVDTNDIGINGVVYGTTPPPGVYSLNVTPYVSYSTGQYGASIVNEHCSVTWNFTRSGTYIIRIWYYTQYAIQASVDETVTAQSGSLTGWYNSQGNPNAGVLAKAEVLYNNTTIYGGRP